MLTLKDKFFVHRKTEKRVQVLNEPEEHGFVELKHLHSGRITRKRYHYFKYEYVERPNHENSRPKIK